MITFVKLEPKHIAQYRELRLACLKNYPKNFGSDYDDERKKEKLYFEIHIENENPNHFVMGVFQENELVGISAFSANEKEKTKHIATILQVYVDPKMQGKGVGKNIMKETIS